MKQLAIMNAMILFIFAAFCGVTFGSEMSSNEDEAGSISVRQGDQLTLAPCSTQKCEWVVLQDSSGTSIFYEPYKSRTCLGSIATSDKLPNQIRLSFGNDIRPGNITATFQCEELSEWNLFLLPATEWARATTALDPVCDDGSLSVPSSSQRTFPQNASRTAASGYTGSSTNGHAVSRVFSSYLAGQLSDSEPTTLTPGAERVSSSSVASRNTSLSYSTSAAMSAGSSSARPFALDTSAPTTPLTSVAESSITTSAPSSTNMPTSAIPLEGSRMGPGSLSQGSQSTYITPHHPPVGDTALASANASSSILPGAAGQASTDVGQTLSQYATDQPSSLTLASAFASGVSPTSIIAATESVTNCSCCRHTAIEM